MSATITETSTSKFVQAGSIRIHYNEIGTGAPMICLHGGGPGASGWSNFSCNVEAFAREHRVLLVDMPQYGKSDKTVITGPRLTSYANIIYDFMRALGIEKADFVGNSLGGQVTLKLAIDHPERVGHIIVIGSTPVNYSLFCPMPVEGIKLINDYYKGEGPTLEKMRKVLQTLAFDPSIVTEEVLQDRYQVSIDPETVKVNQGPRPQREDLTAQFPQVKSPTLVVWGLDDRAGALDVGLLMTRAIPNAQMHIFNHCGHWAQVEHAAVFNQLVLNFFELT